MKFNKIETKTLAVVWFILKRNKTILNKDYEIKIKRSGKIIYEKLISRYACFLYI